MKGTYLRTAVLAAVGKSLRNSNAVALHWENLSDEELSEALSTGELRSAMLTDIEHGRPSLHPDAAAVRAMPREALVKMRHRTYSALVEIRAELKRRENPGRGN